MPVQYVEKEEIVNKKYVERLEQEVNDFTLRHAFFQALLRTLFGTNVRIVFIPIRFIEEPPPQPPAQTNDDKTDEINQRIQTEENLIANEEA